MTVQDIYKKSKSWMFEKPSSNIYDDYIIDIINKVLAETYEENNMCRVFNNLDPLTAIPQVSSTSDDLTNMGIMTEYQLDVIPKGIDANFLMDDDLSKMSKYDVEYNNARVAHQKLISREKLLDAYSKVANV